MHTLWIRRMESQQTFLKEHFPDNPTDAPVGGQGIHACAITAKKSVERKKANSLNPQRG